MKILRLKIAITFFAALTLIANKSFTQQLTNSTALQLIQAHASSIGLSKTDLDNMRISAAYIDKTSNAYMVYVQQTYKGVDVFNSIQTYAFKNGKLISAAGYPLSKIADLVNSKDGKAMVAPANAVSTAAAHLKLFITASLTNAKQTEGIKEFDFGKVEYFICKCKIKTYLVA